MPVHYSDNLQIITAFVGPLAAESFPKTASWRWAIGAFAIIQVFVFAPLGILFKYYERKAKKMGLLDTRASGRSIAQSIVHYFHEFDSECRPILLLISSANIR